MTVPGKRTRSRQYTRKFDYDEARRRHAAGETIMMLAREYGVSWTRVQQVVNPEAGRRAEERSKARRFHCVDCGKSKTSSWPRCVECAALARSTTVRETELRCSSCGRWLPDEAFHKASRFKARRGRRRRCKTCEHADRRDYRRRHLEKTRAYDRKRRRRLRTGQ
jgi:hypothetical protein